MTKTFAYVSVPRLNQLMKEGLTWSDIDKKQRKQSIKKILTNQNWVIGQESKGAFLLNQYLYRMGRTNLPEAILKRGDLNLETIKAVFQDVYRQVNKDVIQADFIFLDEKKPHNNFTLQQKTKIEVKTQSQNITTTWGELLNKLTQIMLKQGVKTPDKLAKIICYLSNDQCTEVLTPAQFKAISNKEESKDKKKKKDNKADSKGKESDDTVLRCPTGDLNRLTSTFRLRSLRGITRMHAGIDLGGKVGTKLYSVYDGVVRKINKSAGGYGRYILIDHPGLVHLGFPISTLYAHVGNFQVKVGDKVKKGEHICDIDLVGRATGPHLHFETRVTDNKGDDDITISEKDMKVDQPWPLGKLWKSSYGYYVFNPLEFNYDPELPKPRYKPQT